MKSYLITSSVIYVLAFCWAFYVWFDTDNPGALAAVLIYFALFVGSVLMARGIRKQFSGDNER